MILRILAIALVLAAGLPAMAQGLPDLGDISSATLSEQQERTIGNRIMREVRIDPAYVDDPMIADYISSIGARLAGAADGPHGDIDYFVVQDDTINAFALIGGHVGVNTALILLTQNESELAGVLAHETAHVLQKHQARMIAAQGRAQLSSLAALLLAIVASRGGGPQSSQVTEAAIASAGALSIQNQLDYTREHEREADRVGRALLEKAGFDPSAMASFFERLLRANRLNELKGAPAYLRTHPLTTERIAEMQDRTSRNATFRMVSDSFDYRLVRAKLRAMTGSPMEAVTLFRTMLEDQTVLRPREDIYGLALAQRRARDLDGAWKTLAPLRAESSHPAFEVLAGQLLMDMHREDEALATYGAALRRFPMDRSVLYGYIDALLQKGMSAQAVKQVDDALGRMRGDAHLYELQARAYDREGRPVAQHRAQAEAYYRKGNLAAAVDQLEIALKQPRGSDFYELSIAESRLRELRAQLEIERAAEKALKIS